MKFLITVCNTATPKDTWGETYTKDLHSLEAIEAWGRETIENFNKTLRPHEKPRSFVAARIINHLEKDPAHLWSEKKNLVTLVTKDGACYDKFTCLKCGIEGKKYGLEGTIHPTFVGDCRNNL